MTKGKRLDDPAMEPADGCFVSSAKDNLPDDDNEKTTKNERSKKMASKKDPKAESKKVVKKEKGKSEKWIFMIEMVKAGKHSRKEIIDAYLKKYGGSPLTVATFLSDGHNPKYCRFPKPLVTNEEGFISFEK